MNTYEAESQIIGGIALYPDECETALDQLSPKDFENGTLGELFEAMQALRKDGKKIDVPLILPQVPQEYGKTLISCAEGFLAITGFDDYVRTVRQESRMRRVTKRLGELVIERPDNILEELAKVIERENEQAECGRYKDLLCQQIVDYIAELNRPFDPASRVYTGFERIDEALGGLRRGTISYIGARPSTGKTTLALNMFRNQIGRTHRCVMFSLEMSVGQIFERMLSDYMNLSYVRINTHKLTKEERGDMARTLSAINDQKRFWVVDDIYTIEGISRALAQIRPDFVIVDFIQCVRTMQRFPTRRNEIDYISSEFKRIAKRYNCHILILSQIARGGQEAPRMSDLKESGALEQDGDYIMLLHRPYVLTKDEKANPPENAELMLDKNKYGNTGKISMRFIGDLQRFVETACYVSKQTADGGGR